MQHLRPIVVLGHKGMLGQMACDYFKKKGHKIYLINHRFNSHERLEFIEKLQNYPNAVVLNCIGKIKQKTDDDNELLWANALLPLALKNHLLPSQTLVHPSTDCVFNGKTTKAYQKEDIPDAKDTYGWSKRLGEVALQDRRNTIIYRVSIIGPDENPNGKGLLNWFLSNTDSSMLNGYTNHYWNGITTLEWCKQIDQLLSTENLGNKTIFEIGGTKESYTKYEMLQLFQENFSTSFNIKPFESEEAIDRRMTPTLVSKKLEDQLKELTQFS